MLAPAAAFEFPVLNARSIGFAEIESVAHTFRDVEVEGGNFFVYHSQPRVACRETRCGYEIGLSNGMRTPGLHDTTEMD